MNEIEKLIREEQLKKDKSDIRKAKRSVETAEFFIEKAKKLFDLKIFDLSLVESYSAMFHSARALLFRDGFKERTHYAVYAYIKNKYKDNIPFKFINELNSLRLERHEFFYNIEKRNEIEEVEAESALQVAGEFIKVAKNLLG